MKKLQVSIVFSLLSFFTIALAQAQTPIARVLSVTGNVFTVLDDKTSTLRDGDYLYRGSQVISEEGTTTIITDFFDHKLTLSGSTDLEVFNNDFKLNRGYVWIQSSHNDQATFKTANSIITFTNGDAILSFDPANDRTQLMSVNGKFTLANALEPQSFVTIADGTFSFVENEYDNGIPRPSTKIGEESYSKLISLFKDVNPPQKRTIETSTNSRSIASVSESAKSSGGGKIIFRRSTNGRSPSSVTTPDQTTKLKNKGVPVTIFKMPKLAKQNSNTKKTTVTAAKPSMEQSRAPASIKEMTPNKSGSTVTINKDFESSLMDAYKKQRRHDGEVLKLIEDLKTYDQDYEQDY